MRIVSVLTLIAGVISLVAGGMNTGVFYAGFGETLAAILHRRRRPAAHAGRPHGRNLRASGPARREAARRQHRRDCLRRPRRHTGAVNIAISPSLQHVLGIVLPALYLICAIALKARKQEEEVK